MDNYQVKSSTGVTLGWACGLAIFFAFAFENRIGLLAGGVLGFAVGQILHLRGELQRLSERLRLVEQGAAAARPDAVAGEGTPVRTSVTTAPLPPTAEPVQAAESFATTVSSPATLGSQQPVTLPRPPDPKLRTPNVPSFFEKALQAALGWFTRGNPLARTGIVVLFFGGAFLAKYAAEHSHLPIEFRFIGLALAALTLLIFGWRLRDSRSIYAQTLQGGGVAGLYLTVFAATKLYQLLSPPFALGLMVVVALTSAVLAVAQDALALAVIGTSGGFLAPLLVSTGSTNHISLFTYYAVLNLGIFAVAWFRSWRVLNLIGLVFTFGIVGVFRHFSYTPEKLLSTDLFVLLFFLMYVAISVLFSLRQKPDLKGYVSSSLVFGLPLAAFAIHATLVSHIQYALAESALSLGAFYLLLGWILFRRQLGNLGLLCEAFAALGIIFTSLAIPLAFDAQITAATWAVEGAGMLWFGVRQQRRLARAFGALLQVLGGIGYLKGLENLHDLQPILNRAYLGSTMLAVAGLLSGSWLFRNRKLLVAFEQSWHSAMAIWGTVWWLGGGLAEIHRAFPDQETGATLIYFALSAILLHLASARMAWPFPGRIALALPPLAALLGMVAAMEGGHPLAGTTWLGWPLLLLAHYFLLFREDRKPSAIAAYGLGALHAGGLWVFALVAAWETHWRVEQQVPGVWADLPWGLWPVALLWLLSRARLHPAWPLRAHESTYRILAAAPLAAFGLGWAGAINLYSDGSAGSLPYLPLLNPLDVSVAVTLATVTGYWLSLNDDQRVQIRVGSPRTAISAIAAFLFLWLNAALIRALHYAAGSPLSLEGIAHSTLVQAAVSVFWGLLGFIAMVVAARRGQRQVWIAGAGLMAVVVVKLFAVDLSNTGTLARIVSFLVVGALLLVTGYLSPLPPRKPEVVS